MTATAWADDAPLRLAPSPDANGLPYLVQPQPGGRSGVDDLLQLVAERQSDLAEKLLKHGAILLRGFAVRDCEQFGRLVEALGQTSLLEYRGGASPRRVLSAGAHPVYNSTDYPADMELPLHNELSYSDAYPDHIYFLCLTAPAEGGDTTLGDSRRILARIPSPVRSRFEAKGVRYIRNLPSGAGSGYSWQDAFGTADREEAEHLCAAMGADLEWLARDVLRVMQVRPAVTVHPVTGAKVWFNQADGFHPSVLGPKTYAELLALCGSEDRFRLNVSFGDGSSIPATDLQAVRQVIREETRGHTWQAGDVLMLDNLLAAHGRRPFRGERRIAVAMS